MFDIYLFTFAKKENSTKQPSLTGQTPFQCDIKSPSSLINPLIELHSNTNPVAFNYAYIPEFNRYFFVSDWRYDRGLWFANFSVDVLATYKPYIGDTNMYITRSSAGHNMYLSDRSYPITNEMTTHTGAQTWIVNDGSFPTGGNFFVNVLSSTGTNGNVGSTCYQMNNTNFRSFIQEIFAKYDDTSLWSSMELAYKNYIYNPINFIYSCYWFPFTITNGTSVSSIKLGGLDVSVSADRIGNGLLTQSHDFSLYIHPQSPTYGYYLNYPPYMRTVFSAKAFGRIEYVPPLLEDASMSLRLYVESDVRTGMTKIYTSDNRINFDVPMGIEVPITQNSSNFFGKASNVVQDNMIGSLYEATGNKLGILKKGLDVVDDMLSLMQRNTTTVGNVGTVANYPFTIKLTQEYYNVTDSDSANNGWPYGKIAKPSTLGGFMIADKCVLDCPATDIELASLRRYVETGFYYE